MNLYQPLVELNALVKSVEILLNFARILCEQTLVGFHADTATSQKRHCFLLAHQEYLVYQNSVDPPGSQYNGTRLLLVWNMTKVVKMSNLKYRLNTQNQDICYTKDRSMMVSKVCL